MNSYSIKEPKTSIEFDSYFKFRWKILRKPQKQILGSEKDEFEDISYHLMVINSSNDILGVGRIHKIEKENYAQIRYMAVSNKYQCKGLGTKILINLEQYAFKKNINKIILHSRENAIGFYEKNGYEVIKKTHILYDSIQHWMMSKNTNLDI